LGLFHRTPTEFKAYEEKTEFDWFFDVVEFDHQSIAAIIVGIITILSGLYVFFLMFDWVSGGIVILSGIALTSLGARKVPDYDTLANAIEDYIKQEIGNSESNNNSSSQEKNQQDSENS